MARFNLGITDVRKITGALTEKGYPDFAGYALMSLKLSLEKIISNHGFKESGAMVSRIYSDDNFTDSLIDELSVETTEMFRDPSMWRLLRERIFPGIFGTGDKIKFWLPGSVSSEDLVSLIILLKESDLTTRSAIILTSLSGKSLDNIASGVFRSSKMEVSEANYTKFQGKGELSEYMVKEGGKFFWNKNLFSEVTFSLGKSHLEASATCVNCIIFRDKMIYMNLTLSNKMLDVICRSLSGGGYFIIGSGESLTHTLFDKHFSQVDQNEKIYQKIR